jgi:hypothetical protein
VTGTLDELSSVLSDGTTAGATSVACAAPLGESDESEPVPRCDVIGRMLVIVGDDIALAWIPTSADEAPVDLLGLPSLLARGDVAPRGRMAARPRPGDRPLLPGGLGYCGTRSCSAMGATGWCTGIQLCFNGSWGACGFSTAETCNALDDDCDLQIDEGGSALCNDGVGCTADSCNGASGCSNTRQPFYNCVQRSGCEIGVCTSATGTSFSRTPGPEDPYVAPLLPSAPGCEDMVGSCIDGDGDGDGDYELPSGCSVLLGHQWCSDSWDSCTCNGPEFCLPPVVPGGPSRDPDNPDTSPPTIGCDTTPPRGPNASGVLTTFDPCDTDANPCTVNRACCETGSAFCRTDAALTASQITQRQASCTLLGSVTATWGTVPGAGVPPTNGVRCSPTTPGSFPRCQKDLNPCTIEGCNGTTGACTRGNVGISTPVSTPESISIPFVTATSGPTCIGDAPGPASCNDLSCNGSGVCNNDNEPDASECNTLGFCAGVGGMRCMTADAPAPFGLPNGCFPPPTRCLVSEPPGVACPANGVPSFTNICMVCDAGRNPWGYSGRWDAVTCNDGNACTTDDRCDGASLSGGPYGTCYGRASSPSGTSCDDTFECSFGDVCNGLGGCFPTSCESELCGAPNCP